MKWIKLFEDVNNPDLDNNNVDEYWFEEGVYESVEDIISDVIYDLGQDDNQKLIEYLKKVFAGYKYSRNPEKAADSFIENEWWNRAVDDNTIIEEIKDCLL